MKRKIHSLTSTKARIILRDGSVRGHKLTTKQRRFFGAVAGGNSIKVKRKSKDGYKRKVDNKMRDYGDTDIEKKIIRVNKKKSKKKGKGELLDTIVHEEMHARHPKMHEKTTRKKTKQQVKRLGQKKKQRLYSRYK